MGFIRKKRAFKKKRVAKRKRAPLRSIKRMVKMEIARNVEDKEVEVYNNGVGIKSVVSGTFSAQVIQLSPGTGIPIQQGVTQGSRVGNSIKIKYATFRGTIVPQQYSLSINPNPQPVIVKMFLFYDKLIAPGVAPTPVGNADFFQFGGTVRTFANNLTDTWAPINTDRYKVFATRTFKVGYASATGTGAQPDLQNFANNDFKMTCPFKVNITKYMVKRVKFNDNSAQPSTRGLYVMFVPTYASGGAIDAQFQVAASQHLVSIKYEDA